MAPVLPVLVPQVVGVDATTDEAGDNSTDGAYQPRSSNVIRCVDGVHTRWKVSTRELCDC